MVQRVNNDTPLDLNSSHIFRGDLRLGSQTSWFRNLGSWLTAGGLFKAMVAEGEILGDEVGFLGDKSADDSPNDPEKEHRHPLCSGIGAGV